MKNLVIKELDLIDNAKVISLICNILENNNLKYELQNCEVRSTLPKISPNAKGQYLLNSELLYSAKDIATMSGRSETHCYASIYGQKHKIYPCAIGIKNDSKNITLYSQADAVKLSEIIAKKIKKQQKVIKTNNTLF